MQILNQAIIEIATRLLPDGFDVSDHAPQTYEDLKALMDAGNRMLVWSGGSEDTIYKEPHVNCAFRGWHDLCHWRGQFPFTLEGEVATCEMQCRQLLEFCGTNETTLKWCTVLRAEIIGQAKYFQRHKRFPKNQSAFVAAYLCDRKTALQWPFW
jgi:hypothetical protein